MATASVLAIEDGGGTDAATATTSTTLGYSVALTLVKDQVFERNESINGVLSTAGGATNNNLVFVQFENIH